MIKYCIALIVAIAAGFLLTPANISPIAWAPAPAFELDPGSRLDVSKLRTIDISDAGPEDIDVFPDGTIVAGTVSGSVLLTTEQDKSISKLIDTSGRPLGMDIGPNGNLYIADAYRGILKITREGKMEVLVEPDPIRFVNDLDVSSKGEVFYSTTTENHQLSEYKLDIVESRPMGRLYRFNPKTRLSELLLEGLHFANGVTLSKDESFVLIVETTRYQVKRLWLDGDNKGMSDVFIMGIPGFPDGISTNINGEFWLAVVSPRSDLLDHLGPWPWLRKQLHKLPESLKPQPIRELISLKLSTDGKVVSYLLETNNPPIGSISSLEEKNGSLYLGSLFDKKIGVLPLVKTE